MHTILLGVFFALVVGCARGQGPDDFGDDGVGGSTPSGGLPGYHYRRAITITGTAPEAYSLALTVDHALLVGESKATPDGADLRIAYEDAGVVTELDRLVDPRSAFNTATTKIWFRTVEGVGTGTYYLYYGNSAAGSPPTNGNMVFELYDDFQGAAIAEEWSVAEVGDATGSAEVKAGAARLTGSSGDITGTADDFVFLNQEVSGNVVIDAEIKDAGGSLGATSKLGGLMVRQSAAVDSRFIMMTILQTPRARFSARREAEGVPAQDTQLPVPEEFPQLVRVQRTGAQTSALYSDDGVNYIALGDSATLTLTDPFLLGVPLANISGGNGYIDTEWIRARKLVSPEPSAATGNEEML